MRNDEKINKWIEQKESEGWDRDRIIRTQFVSKSENGEFTTYKLRKSGKTKYHLDVYVGAVNLDELY